tara:strand:+ start:1466 stop:2299 length:834 start_codon:yes stop_codon:yes gene_type:complete
MSNSLVTAAWLNEHLSDENLVILDSSPTSNVSGLKSELDGLVIPGARYFDLKGQFSDPKSPYPNTMPSPGDFQKAARSLGINTNSEIIVYDNLGVYTSPRVWWMFKAMGHDRVSVLDGGLADWVKNGFATKDSHQSAFPEGDFTARFQADAVKSMQEVIENINQSSFELVDARSKGRFEGTAPEPREGMSSGHLPNSCNLPFEDVLNDGKFKSPEELRQIFSDLKLGDKPITFSCGSGLTACIILLAAEQVLPNQKSVYDGSWTEYASTPGVVIEKS